MSIDNVIESAKKYFPKLDIKYKDESKFMKLLGTILFFNKGFMTSYTTTINSTVYFPSRKFLKYRPISGAIILLHELVHIKDSNKLSAILFSFLYLFPQILSLFCIPLFFFAWKIALPLLILFLSPLPAYFRMIFEKRAYFASLYVLHKLSKTQKFDPRLEENKQFFLSQFKGTYYYFMWLFPLSKDFDKALLKIKNDERPYEDNIFDAIDELIEQL